MPATTSTRSFSDVPDAWPSRWPYWALALIAGLVLLCSGCAALPTPTPQPATTAIADFEPTRLARMTERVLPGDDRSGFRLLPFGPSAFATRIELTRLANRTLDVQYYLLQADNTGLALMRALRDAAARGVRVRLLVDDLYTAGEDELLLALASFPNVEVRLFNPFPAGRGSQLGRYMASGFDFRRINRRMHNKLFVADNAVAVAGGRNMADEYVMNADGSNFVDMDVFAAGPVVRDFSRAFDTFWNSEVVYPVQAIASSGLARGELQARFEAATARARPPEATEVAPGDKLPGIDGDMAQDIAEALNTRLLPMFNLPFELQRARLGPLLWAKARVVADPLTKTAGRNQALDSLDETVAGEVVYWLTGALDHIKMVSPYFVPSRGAVASIGALRARGVGVELVTNSLASTDEPWVYIGYWAHMRDLLDMGVEIRELSPTLSAKRKRYGITGRRTGALHMKNAIRDHREVFLGSLNLDQRSAKINTELGVIIDSPEMAAQLESFADVGSAYSLRLKPANGGVEWVEKEDDGRETVYDIPPETTAWQRFKLRVMGPFIPESEL
ncbi:MAG: phospholipase D/Transphosphatidylase [Rhodoferax sp.]|nr:phospholipase D/Transphosphatidylase [Rhodoferax sp.]